ncbi:MFS transporter [Peribacillus aracenensis]|uniref:MFS transporter n=1 Tax=Peribacillus aracenensis TaxID=2976708 RepID=UPI0021A4033C|nr:MFS transporter [Peribacillus sp. BBB004]
MLKRNFRWITVFWILFIAVVAYFDRVNFSVSASLISKEFGLNPAQLGIIMSGFTFGYLLSSFPGGLLSQRFPSRVIITVSLIGWSIATIFTGIAWSFVSLLLARIIFGILEGPFFPNANKIISAWVLPKDRGLASGLWITGVPIGIVIGNLISVGIIGSLGWRSIFYIFGSLGVIMAIITWRILRDQPKEHPLITKEEKELIESSQAQFRGDAVSDSKGSTVIQLLKNPWVWVITLTYFVFTLVFWANVNWLPTYFIQARGSNIMEAGVNSSIPWIAMGMGTLILCRLADTGKGYKSPWLAFSLFAMAPTIAYAVITPSVIACLVSFSLASFFVGGAIGLVPAHLIDLFEVADVPKVHGLVLTGGSLAGVIAPILVGFVLQITDSFNYAYYVFSFLAFVGGLLGLALFYNEKKVLQGKAFISTVQSTDEPGYRS